jgi:hypothetical protein
MKLTAQILLFFFIAFLITPTIVSVIEKNADISVFYSFSEEEKAQKEIKAIFNNEFSTAPDNTYQLNHSLILSENLSKHDKIFSKIFIPPPEQI